MNWTANGAEFSWEGLGYFGIGAVAGALSAGIGAGVNVAMAGGSFAAGFAGTAGGMASTGFGAGFVTGFASGFTSSFISGAGNSWMQGNGFDQGLFSGFNSGFRSGFMGGTTGGIMGGFDALTKGVNFWTGEGTFDLSNAYGASGKEIGKKTVTGKYVGKFEGVNVYESKMLGEYSSSRGYSGVTIPERGIIVGKGVYRGDWDMMKHEFGHILQYRKHGSVAYWNVFASESLHSATFNPNSHSNFWVETYANYLGKNYFGSWNISDYPVQNISYANYLKVLRFQFSIWW